MQHKWVPDKGRKRGRGGVNREDRKERGMDSQESGERGGAQELMVGMVDKRVGGQKEGKKGNQ